MHVEESWPDPEPVDEIGLLPPPAGSVADTGSAGADTGFGSGAMPTAVSGEAGSVEDPRTPDHVPEPQSEYEHEHEDSGDGEPGQADTDGELDADAGG